MLDPSIIEALRLKELRGELTLEDTRLFIESTRAAFLSRPEPREKGAPKPPKGPVQEDVDFF